MVRDKDSYNIQLSKALGTWDTKHGVHVITAITWISIALENIGVNARYVSSTTPQLLFMSCL